MNRNYNLHSESSHSQVSSGLLASELERVKATLEFECYDPAYEAQAEEICLIIAEMAILPPSATVQIGGNKLTAEVVREIYSMLTHEDIVTVMDNFEEAAYKIKFKKTYLRTALYNEVFERSSRVINGVRSDIPEYSRPRKERIQRR